MSAKALRQAVQFVRPIEFVFFGGLEILISVDTIVFGVEATKSLLVLCDGNICLCLKLIFMNWIIYNLMQITIVVFNIVDGANTC